MKVENMSLKNYLMALFFCVGVVSAQLQSSEHEVFVQRCSSLLLRNHVACFLDSYFKKFPNNSFSVYAIPAHTMCVAIDGAIDIPVFKAPRYQSNEVVVLPPALTAYHLAMMNAQGYSQIPRPEAVVPPALIIVEQPSSAEEVAPLLRPEIDSAVNPAPVVVKKKRQNQSIWRSCALASSSDEVDLVFVCGVRSLL